MHNYGLAVDVVPFLSGSCGELNWKANTEQFRWMVAVFKAQGLEWGGDWHGDLGDFDHFQMPKLPTTPTQKMRDVLVSGLPKVWSEAAAGTFAV